MKKNDWKSVWQNSLSGSISLILAIAVYFTFSHISQIGSAFQNIRSILAPFLIGGVMAYLLKNPCNFLEEHLEHMIKNKKRARIHSVFFTLLMAFLILYLLLSMILPEIIDSIATLINIMPSSIERFTVWVSNILSDNEILKTYVNTTVNDLSDRLQTWMSKDLLPTLMGFMGNAASNAASTVGSIVTVVKNIVIGIIVCIYLLLDRKRMAKQAKAVLYAVLKPEQAEKLLLAGVMLRDPARFDLRGTLTHGRDVEIDTNVIIEGNVTLGHRVKIGTGCVIKNSVIGDDCEISPYTVVEDANLAAACTIGPFARLRPGAELLEGAHVGNFVEMKKARLGKGSKAGHLTYLGDAEIGDNVNIGAGTITCNYDGANKFKTIIGDDVFVGSDTQLVAPVTVGKGATIAAGTTVTRNVGENALAISRVPQTHKEGWRRPVKKK